MSSAAFFPRATRKVPRLRSDQLPKVLRKSPPVQSTPVFEHIGNSLNKHVQRLPGGKVLRVRSTGEKRPQGEFLYGMPARTQWVHPKDRIQQWSIAEGDEVRVLVGPDWIKYNNEEEGKASGYKIYTVHKLEQKLNRVLLKGLGRRNPLSVTDKPEAFDSWPEERRNRWSQSRNNPKLRPIQVSNLGLLVAKHETDPTQHVFAKRLKTSAPVWDKEASVWKWDRYASGLTGQIEGGESVRETERGYWIDWPRGGKKGEAGENQEAKEAEEPTRPEENDYRADQTISEAITYRVPEAADHSATSGFADVVQIAAKGNTHPAGQAYRGWYDEHFHRETVTENDILVDNLMPLFISEELAPRYALNKRLHRFEAAKADAAARRQAAIDEAVADWEANGRDRHLREAMDSPLANLAGVPLRYRTRSEVEEQAGLKFDMAEKEAKRETVSKLRHGFVKSGGEWVPGPKQIKTMARRIAKAEKAEEKKERLETLTLKPGKNMYVPPELLKEGSARV